MLTTKDLLKTDRRKIREHWKKSDAQMEIEIGIIRNWIKTQKHLPEVPCDKTIEYFLTNCKFSTEKTKRTLDMYYTVRDLIPDFYENKHPGSDRMKLINEVLYTLPLPELTENLHRITIFKLNDVDPDTFDIYDHAGQFLRNLFEIKTKEDLTLGEIFVMDCKHAKFATIIKCTPMYVKKIAFVLENVWANRLNEMHLVNVPTYMDRLIALSRTLLSKKLRERIYVHESLDDMFKAVPQELLPSDYGGKAPSMDELKKLWIAKFKEYTERFDKMEELKVNEKLRPEKMENSELLGYHGNFKKIDVD
uniref:Alpha-tocopherol transfer protein-like n=1 Tax=Diabrotica virgifera virgifera TaxID=50390 RepID=A0A6P7GBK9_DIAVI